MTVSEFAQLLSASGSALAAFAAVIAALISARNSRKIAEVHKSTNGKMDALLRVVGASEHAKGVIEGEGGRGKAGVAKKRRRSRRKVD